MKPASFAIQPNNTKALMRIPVIVFGGIGALACGGAGEGAKNDSGTAAQSGGAAAANVAWPQQDNTNTVDNLYRLTLGPDAASVPTCDAAVPVFSKGAVGPIGMNMPAAEFLRVCPQARLVWRHDEWVEGGEGLGEGILVRLGKPIVLLHVQDLESGSPSGRRAHIVTVETADTSARNADGVGPGSSLQRLRDQLGPATVTDEQCLLVATFDRSPGIRYRLTPAGSRADRDCAFIKRMAETKDGSSVHPRTLVSLMYVDMRAPTTTGAGSAASGSESKSGATGWTAEGAKWGDPQNAWQLQNIFSQLDSDDEPSALRACSETTPVVTPDSVGPLRVGQTIADVGRACPGAQLGYDWSDENVPQRAFAVRFGKYAVVVGTFGSSADEVSRLAFASQSLHTDRGAFVQMRFDSLTAIYGAAEVEENDCNFRVSFQSAPHLQFLLATRARCPYQEGDTIPGGSIVERIIVRPPL